MEDHIINHVLTDGGIDWSRLVLPDVRVRSFNKYRGPSELVEATLTIVLDGFLEIRGVRWMRDENTGKMSARLPKQRGAFPGKWHVILRTSAKMQEKIEYAIQCHIDECTRRKERKEFLKEVKKAGLLEKLTCPNENQINVGETHE